MLSAANKIEVTYHDIRKDISWSLLFGSAAYFLLNDQDSWLFYLAIRAIIIGAFTLSYWQSRNKSLASLPNETLQASHNHELPLIRHSYLSGTDPDQLDEGERYYLGHCIKRGFAEYLELFVEKSQFKHSSITLVPQQIMNDLKKMQSEEEKDAYLKEKKGVFVYGRIMTFFNQTNPSGFLENLYQHNIKSKIDNEKKYILFPRAAFECVISEALFTGKEIKSIISQVDTLICNAQYFDLINSNCHSGSICVLAVAIEHLKRRYAKQWYDSALFYKQGNNTDIYTDNSDMTAQQIRNLSLIMLNAMKHNLGQGVLNNPEVITQVNKAIAIANKFKVQLSGELIERDVVENKGFRFE